MEYNRYRTMLSDFKELIKEDYETDISSLSEEENKARIRLIEVLKEWIKTV
jgi:hypothetical protein